MSERMFPVLCNWERRKLYESLGIPRSVPWSMLAPHEAQAERNHDQSLVTLKRRGGLDVSEMAAVITGRTWRQVREAGMTPEQAAAIVLDALAKHTPPATGAEKGE